MNRKIVITGANGQLGSEFRAIAGTYADSFVFTDIDTLDLTDKKAARAFLEKEAPDLVVNCAAYTAVDKAEDNREMARALNVRIPRMLAEYGNNSGCRIVHISTDYVFGDNGTCLPRKTMDEAKPLSVYGETKLEGEQEILKCETGMVIRTSWLYSIYGPNFVRSMTRLMQERDELRVVYDQVGTPTHAADLAGAIMKVTSDTGHPFEPGIYHYTNEGIASWYDFACEIRELTGASCRIVPIETREYPLPAKRPAFAVLSKEKIIKVYGLEIPHWRDSLKHYFELLK